MCASLFGNVWRCCTMEMKTLHMNIFFYVQTTKCRLCLIALSVTMGRGVSHVALCVCMKKIPSVYVTLPVTKWNVYHFCFFANGNTTGNCKCDSKGKSK